MEFEIESNVTKTIRSIGGAESRQIYKWRNIFWIFGEIWIFFRNFIQKFQFQQAFSI